MRCAALFAVFVVSTPSNSQDPEPGIARTLARARAARVSKLEYDLELELAPKLSEVAGRALIRFELAQPERALVLDFAGAGLDDLVVNERVVAAPERKNGHVILAPELLRQGPNELRARFRSRVAATGTPLTVHRDAGGDELYYTLLVPAEAHGLFPCFDQPDLKAKFRLRLVAPREWTVVANAPLERTTRASDESARHEFAATPPLPTYLFAFAAGPFAIVTDEASGLRAYLRPARVRHFDQRLFAMHAQALQQCTEYFGIPYPFGKLEFVLLPGFPYGGMEHAGAIFYAESQLLFDRPLTESEQVRRSTLVYHEVAHQWFGNLVTMEWFDDLWLKEGFATFVGYKLLEQLEPGRNAWLRFHQRVKPAAYEVDATTGTTPVFQSLENLAHAKSAYGAIVYNKAPAVLRELEQRLQPARFQRGVQRFLREHAFGNARWSDLVQALEQAAEGSATEAWSQRWILAPGMPRVRARVEVDAEERMLNLWLEQESVLADGGLWPLRVEVLLLDRDRTERIPVDLATAQVEVEALRGRKLPGCVLLNPGDVAYGQFLLDARSREWLLEHHAELDDPLITAVALSALFESVRAAELDPARHAQLALARLEREADAETFTWLLGTFSTCALRYCEPGKGDELVATASELLLRRLQRGAPGLELEIVRFLARCSRDAKAFALFEAALDGKPLPAGLSLGLRDRFLLATALLAAGRGAARLDRFAKADDPDAARYAYVARAAAADAATKQRYFASYLQPSEPPEQWIRDSLDSFHWPRQSELTLPYLERALGQVDFVKLHRRIFFMPAWIDSFVNAHATPAALAIVERFLEQELEPDVRRKVLQSLDGLQRAVRIRARWK